MLPHYLLKVNKHTRKGHRLITDPDGLPLHPLPTISTLSRSTHSHRSNASMIPHRSDSATPELTPTIHDQDSAHVSIPIVKISGDDELDMPVITVPSPSVSLGHSRHFSTGVDELADTSRFLEAKATTSNHLLQRRRSGSFTTIDLENGDRVAQGRETSIKEEVGETAEMEFFVVPPPGSIHVDDAQSLQGISLHSVNPEAGDNSTDSRAGTPQEPEVLFHAFPRSRWFRPIWIAVVGFCVMTLMVLGDLIYTYVSCFPDHICPDLPRLLTD